MRWLRLQVCPLLSSVLLVVMSACDGGSGDPCQVETDCDDGLICCGAARFGSPTRGICASSCTDIVDDGSMGDAIMSLPDGSSDSALTDAAADASTDADVPDATPDASADADVPDATPDASGDANVPDAE